MSNSFKIFIVIATLLIGTYFYYFHFLDINKTGISGTVVKLPYEYWGIESDRWYKPTNVTVTNLPTEFQKEGLTVKCDATVTDVIGTRKWDVVAEVNNCSEE